MTENIQERPTAEDSMQVFIHARANKWSEVENLLRRGLNVNAKNPNAESATLLHYAVAHKNLDAVKMLVEDFGADINSKNLFNSTPLDLCNTLEHGLVSKYLVLKGAMTGRDLSDEYKSPFSTLDAKGYKHKEKPKLFFLAGGYNWDAVGNALRSGRGDVNAKDDYNIKGDLTLLHYAVSQRNLNAVKMLVEEFHADINPTNSRGMTPLDICTSSEYEPIKQYLLTQGAKSGKDLLKDHKSSPSTTPTSVTIPPDSTNATRSYLKSYSSFWNSLTPAKKAAIEILALSAAEGVACLSILFSTDKQFFSHAGNYDTVSGINDALKTNVGMTTFTSIALGGLILIAGLYLYNRRVSPESVNDGEKERQTRSPSNNNSTTFQGSGMTSIYQG